VSPELAVSLVQRMAAAFPSPRWSEDTLALYVEELTPFDFEPAERAITHVVRECIARPSLAALRDEIDKRTPSKLALEGPVDEPLPTWSFALSRRPHPGQGDTPNEVVLTTRQERRELERVYRESRERYLAWIRDTTPEDRAKQQREAYHRWRDRKMALRQGGER